MAGIGPAPTPTAILEARGSWLPGTRKGEPRPAIERPTCPQALKGEARAEWNRQVRELIKLRVISKLDRALLAGWCEAWAEFISLVKQIEKEGRTYKTENGLRKMNPALKAKNEAAHRMLQFSAKLGFSPADRTRLRTEAPPVEDDPLERLLDHKN